ncbi:hypothetical protein K501DRAFT_283992 [Backusella circina FSU 941]|nr:hypothetical protein K501DRAFT_283992 [Backusella circina FSU 941]
MTSCAAFTDSLSMWSPISSIYFDHNNNNDTGITASPTIQYTVNDYFYQHQDYDESRYFHHEPVVYPSACIICGLPHHPVPHTAMSEEVQETYTFESTPAPRKPNKKQNHLKTASHDLEKRNKKKQQDWVTLIRGLFYRWLSVCQNSIRPSRRKRHNIYPVKKEHRLA